MKKARTTGYLDLPAAAEAALIDGARDVSPVKGLTHGYYKYPARFSPSFARAAIKTFTKPGDICFDPHVGGGTTLVEAIAAGREAVGVDISTLAEFVAGVKCTVFSEAELNTLERWAGRVAMSVDIHKPRSRTINSSDTISISIIRRAGGCGRRSSNRSRALSGSAHLGWSRLADVSYCGPRNGRWMVGASVRRSTISVASLRTPRQIWCAALAI